VGVQQREHQHERGKDGGSTQPDHLRSTAGETGAGFVAPALMTPFPAAWDSSRGTAAHGEVSRGQLNPAQGVATQPPRGGNQHRRATQQNGGVHQVAAVFLAGWARIDVPDDAFAQQDAELAVPVDENCTELRASLRVALGSASHQQCSKRAFDGFAQP
jgi:hypothetical protein